MSNSGYSALAEKIFISYLCDLLRPHNIHNKLSVGLHKHTCNNGKVYYHPRNRIARIEAERFFKPYNKDLQFWCDIMNWESTKVLEIVNYCIKNNQDRLYGKHALQAYFNAVYNNDGGFGEKI